VVADALGAPRAGACQVFAGKAAAVNEAVRRGVAHGRCGALSHLFRTHESSESESPAHLRRGTALPHALTGRDICCVQAKEAAGDAAPEEDAGAAGCAHNTHAARTTRAKALTRAPRLAARSDDDAGGAGGACTLPLARVKRIIRLDTDVKQTQADAVRLIGRATVRARSRTHKRSLAHTHAADALFSPRLSHARLLACHRSCFWSRLPRARSTPCAQPSAKRSSSRTSVRLLRKGGGAQRSACRALAPCCCAVRCVARADGAVR
jgi:hypothetical protein